MHIGAQWWAVVPAILLASIFLLDVSQPPAIVFSMLYVAPIVLTLGTGGSRATYMAFIVSSVATVAATAFGVPAANPSAAFTNRCLALLAQVLAATVVIQQWDLRSRFVAPAREAARDTPLADGVHRHAAERIADVHSLIASLPEALILIDAAGLLVEANEAALHLLQVERARLEGYHWSQLVPLLNLCAADGRPFALSPAVCWPIGDAQPFETEVLLQHTAAVGPIRCAVIAVPLRDGHGMVQGGLVVVRDVTAFRAGEAQKDALISMAVHELRSPLATLRGYAQLAQKSAHTSGMPAISVTMEKLLRQADRLNHLIDDLLDVSRLHLDQLVLQYASIDAAALVTEVVEQTRVRAPMRSIDVIVADGLPPLQADAHRLQQVLTNLLDNAIKYSPEGGAIQVMLWCDDQRMRLSVRDQGVGIPEAEQDLVFQRFYRGRAEAHRFTGLGIGLYISNQLIARHGGHMWVESVRGQGSTFTFALPLTAPDPIRLT